MSVPILSARAIVKSFGGRRWFGGAAPKRAVDAVDLDVHEGETLAIVGESGSGKSTLARILLGLARPTAGTVEYQGQRVDSFTSADWATFRKAVQPVFQDPASSLNPRMRVESTLSHVLRRHKLATRDTLDAEIGSLLASVGLDAAQFRDRYPHQLSGGQQQRIAIARAMAVRPRLIIADEPLSSLDMSVQAQILDLLVSLKATRNLGLVLISHDLNVVDAISDRVIVMYLGRIVEAGPTRQVLGNPSNDYTRSLLAAKLVADPHIARARRRAVDDARASGPISPSNLQGAPQ
ncbi:MAG: ABC transporter ATP-binding protein [Reyranella sp.]|nr:ABC transporter ATP-binding protein [Reyranella sp.]